MEFNSERTKNETCGSNAYLADALV